MSDEPEIKKEPAVFTDISESYSQLMGNYINLLTQYAEVQMKQIKEDTENLANVIKCHMDLPN